MWHPLAPLSEFPDRAGREFTVEDRIVAVFRDGDRLWALDGICPHAGGPLAEGDVTPTATGAIVTCPWHGWQFDVSTGKHCLSAQIRQQRFPVQVEEGIVMVELP
ncbi:MAG TPA: Rieske 2Fe-2S domain-containing protein [Planctomicrobium sp.]|nr:Rieske 2Fe-2S domain-containing protein [Planctomicrobium sp.]